LKQGYVGRPLFPIGYHFAIINPLEDGGFHFTTASAVLYLNFLEKKL
jgi:hypothetical protein